MGAAVAITISAIGAGISAYGSMQSADDQSNAMNKDAHLKELQAQEVEREQSVRASEEDINNQKTLGSAVSGYSESGFDLGGSNLLAMESMYSDMQRQKAEEQKEADYKAMIIRAGAGVESQQASDILTSGYINAAGGLVKSTGTILSLTGGSTSAPKPTGGGGGSPSYYTSQMP